MTETTRYEDHMVPSVKAIFSKEANVTRTVPLTELSDCIGVPVLVTRQRTIVWPRRLDAPTHDRVPPSSRKYRPTINGNNGEATNTDDMPRKGKTLTTVAVVAPKLGRTPKHKKKKVQLVRGDGDYITDAATGGSMLLGAGTAYLTGSPTAGLLMKRVSRDPMERLIHRVVAAKEKGRITGSGVYDSNDCAYNALFKQSWGPGHPHFGGDSGTRPFRSKQTIVLGDLVMPGSGNLSVTYPLQPGLWGENEAGRARGYNHWLLKRAFLEFESSLGVGTSGAEGMLTLYHNSNPNAAACTDYLAAGRTGFPVDVRFDGNALCGIEGEGAPLLLVRDGDVTGTKSDYDYGFVGVYAAPSASLANTRVGRLSLHIDIEYHNPRNDPDVYGYAHITSTTFTSASPMLSPTLVQAYGCFYGLSVTGTTITFTNARPGHAYLIQFGWVSAVTAVLTLPSVTYSNCVGVNIFGNNTLAVRGAPQSGATAANMSFSAAVYISDTSPAAPYITLSGAAIAGTPSYMDVHLTPLPASTTNTYL